MSSQKFNDIQKIDIAKPVERKKFKVTSEMVILVLIAIAQYMAIKIFIIDGILFNPNLELELFQRDFALIVAKITHVPDVNIDFSMIDTTNIYTVIHQTLKYFVVDPVMHRAETQIMEQINQIFSSLDIQGKLF